MDRIILTDERHIWELIEQARQGSTVRMLGLGGSMRPFLKDGRDFIDLVAVKENTELRKADVIFYKSHEGRYVAHRIARVSRNGYVPNGDWNLTLEPSLKREGIYLKASGFVRKGKYVAADSIKYRCYAKLWLGLFPVRPFLLRWYGRGLKLCKVISKGKG
jgi:hypothetical protein